jgi:glutathione S-transferase
MSVTLYALPASHPCAAVEAALRLKGVPYRRIDMLPLAQLVAGPALYRGITVPGMKVDGTRIVGSRAIMRRLDEMQAQPPLLPDDAAKRAAVLDAERWGDEVLQSAVRRILDAGWMRSPRSLEGYATGSHLPIEARRLRALMPLTARLMAIRNSARDSAVRADLAALPSQLQKVEQWVADGVLGGDPPNAADLQIGSSIRLLQTVSDVRPIIDAHPAVTALTRHFPGPQPGEIPAGTLPRDWLPGASGAAPAPHS